MVGAEILVPYAMRNVGLLQPSVVAYAIAFAMDHGDGDDPYCPKKIRKMHKEQ